VNYTRTNWAVSKRTYLLVVKEEGGAFITRDSRQFLPTPGPPRMRILTVGLGAGRRMLAKVWSSCQAG